MTLFEKYFTHCHIYIFIVEIGSSYSSSNAFLTFTPDFNSGNGLIIINYTVNTYLRTFKTPGNYSFVVPSNVFALSYDVLGAAGGNGYNDDARKGMGGNGSQVMGTMAVIPAQKYYLFVGGKGLTVWCTVAGSYGGGYNGGGGGYCAVNNDNKGGGGGMFQWGKLLLYVVFASSSYYFL